MELNEALELIEKQKVEIAKLADIKREVVQQRDDVKKQFTEVETKLAGYEEVVAKTSAELEKERARAEEITTLHTSMLKVGALKEALEKEGVIAVDTALKLVPLDKIAVGDGFSINRDTVAEVVTKLRETDSVLFKQKGAPAVDATDVPKPKRASEGEPKAGFGEELKQCKTAAEVETLLRRHGKIA